MIRAILICTAVLVVLCALVPASAPSDQALFVRGAQARGTAALQEADVIALDGCQEVTYDNGDANQTGGISHLTDPARRSILDDFLVEGDGIVIKGYTSIGLWQDGGGPHGTAYELALFENDPDLHEFGGPGELIAPLETYNYDEVATGRSYQGLDEYRSTMDVTPYYVAPGKYWLDMHIVGPMNYFQSDRNWDPDWFPGNAAIWVDFEDFGGLQPGFNIFGQNFEMSFSLLGLPAAREDVAIQTIDPLVFSGEPQGGLAEIGSSDDDYFVITTGSGVRATRPYVAVVEFETTLDEEELAALTLHVESRADQPLVFQEIRLFDFDADQAVLLDSRQLPHDGDLVLSLPVGDDPQRFVRDSDGLVRIRIEGYSGAFTIIRPSLMFDEIKVERTFGVCEP